MADPFEVRLRFTSLLTHLTASQTSSGKAAAYALKHRDMDEDLHSCIIECLDSPSTSMNARANVMYFLDHFCDYSLKEGHEAYIDMIRRDLNRIVGLVCASTKLSSGSANIKVVRKVVTDLGTKGILDKAVVEEIDGDLRRQEVERAKGLDESAERSGLADSSQSRRVAVQSSVKQIPQAQGLKHKLNGTKVDTRAIEQRIEEDRERNKRLRENVWAVLGDNMDELNKMWEETSDLNEDDFVIAREEAEERSQFARYQRTLVTEGIAMA